MILLNCIRQDPGSNLTDKLCENGQNFDGIVKFRWDQTFGITIKSLKLCINRNCRYPNILPIKLIKANLQIDRARMTLLSMLVQIIVVTFLKSEIEEKRIQNHKKWQVFGF